MENLLSILPVLATDLSLTDFTFWIGFAAMFADRIGFACCCRQRVGRLHCLAGGTQMA